MPKTILPQVPLAPYTTLGVGGSAEFFTEVTTIDALVEALEWAALESHPVTILAGGSNVLVRDAGVKGLVLRPCFSGITYRIEGTDIFVTAGAGVVLDELIHELVTKGYWGLENLSAIPGTVGAVPVQNVGAYGVEAKDVVHEVQVYDRVAREIKTLSKASCALTYRNSIFKQNEGKHYVILAVTFTLQSQPRPKILYKDLANIFSENTAPSLDAVRTAVIDIRRKKFPDWHIVGTAGSFFKNPIIEKSLYDYLLKEFPELPGFPVGEKKIKVALGWILDSVCHLRGYREGNVGLFEAQALVLVCEKETSGDAVETFSQKIIERVFAETGIDIEREVTILT